MNQPELFFHEIFHLKDPLVGLLAFFYFGTEHGGGRFKKNHPVFFMHNDWYNQYFHDAKIARNMM